MPFSKFIQTAAAFRMKLHSPKWPHSHLPCCCLPLRRAFSKLHADHDGDLGTYSLHPLYTDRCSSPDASAAEPELRQGHPFCSCIFHREPSGSSSGSSSFFSFEGLHISVFRFCDNYLPTTSLSLSLSLFFWLELGLKNWKIKISVNEIKITCNLTPLKVNVNILLYIMHWFSFCKKGSQCTNCFVTYFKICLEILF